MQAFLKVTILAFFLTGISISAFTKPTTTTTPSKEYLETMEWLVLQSNNYSGVLNERQTWVVSFNDYIIKEEYYWDGELTVVIEFDIRKIDKAQNELRFFNSICLYPSQEDESPFDVTRIEEGMPNKIEAEYYNLMIDPTQKKEVLEKVRTVLRLSQETE